MKFRDLALAIDEAHLRPASRFSEAISGVGREFRVASRWRELLASAQDLILSGELPRGSSHAHENGFQKIGLFRSPSGLQIRLHVWYSDGARDVSSIHDHRWDFASFVVVGGLFARNYVAAEPLPGEKVYLRRFLSDAIDGQLKVAEDAGTCRLLTHSEYEVSAGGSHFLSADVPHLAYPVAGTEVTASLVITAPAVKAGSTQYIVSTSLGAEPPKDKDQSARDLYSPRESVDWIARLLETVA